MVQVQRIVVGAAAALALVIGSVIVAPVRAPGSPNCLAAPCPPPPENRSGADVDRVSLAGDAQDAVRAPGAPNCLTAPCPPPTNDHSVMDVKEALLGGDVHTNLVAGGPVCLTMPCPPPKGA